MDKLGSLVIDLYDDPLSPLEKEASDFPDYVKGSGKLSSDDLASMSDDKFAVVIFEQNGAVHRKWPLIDRAHVYMAAYYWSLSEGLLPDIVRKPAAHFILENARLWGIEGDLPNRSKLDEARRSLSVVPSSNVVDISSLNGRLSEMTRMSPDDGRKKTYTATGDGSPYGGGNTKLAFALPGKDRYPIHTKALVKRAMDYFEQNERDIAFDERFEMARNIVKQADEFGLEVRPSVEKYASCGVRPETSTFIRLRSNYVGQPGWPQGGESAIEKMASAAEHGELPPGMLMRMLTAFDKTAGLDDRWGKKLPDPARTFAAGRPKFQKEASFIQNVDGVPFTQVDLDRVLMEKKAELNRLYGPSVVETLSKEGSGALAFREMSETRRRHIAKLAGVFQEKTASDSFAEGVMTKESSAKGWALKGLAGLTAAGGAGLAGHEVGKRRYRDIDTIGLEQADGPDALVFSSKPIRNKLQKIYEQKGQQAMFEAMRKMDPESFKAVAGLEFSGQMKQASEKLEGGLADEKEDSEFDKKKLKAGAKVEKEHTDDKGKAKEIAKDHLEEDSKYYEKLKKVEG